MMDARLLLRFEVPGCIQETLLGFDIPRDRLRDAQECIDKGLAQMAEELRTLGRGAADSLLSPREVEDLEHSTQVSDNVSANVWSCPSEESTDASPSSTDVWPSATQEDDRVSYHSYDLCPTSSCVGSDICSIFSDDSDNEGSIDKASPDHNSHPNPLHDVIIPSLNHLVGLRDSVQQEVQESSDHCARVSQSSHGKRTKLGRLLRKGLQVGCDDSAQVCPSSRVRSSFSVSTDCGASINEASLDGTWPLDDFFPRPALAAATPTSTSSHRPLSKRALAALRLKTLTPNIFSTGRWGFRPTGQVSPLDP